MIKLLPKTPEQELLNIFTKFFKDEQDSVRMQVIDCCVAFTKHLNASVIMQDNYLESEFLLDALH